MTAKAVLNGKTYVCRSIARRQIEDFIAPVPSTGRQSAQTRFLRNSVVFGNVLDAYGGRTLGPWSESQTVQEHFAHGHIHHYHDSEAETRFGGWTAPRQKNTVTFPTLAVIGNERRNGIFGGSNTTRQHYNDRPGVYYAGSTTAGVFFWEGADTTANNSSVESYAWTGAGFSSGVFIVSDVISIEMRGYDYTVHKGSLFWVGTTNRGTAAANAIRKSTTGASWAAPGTEDVSNAWLEGTRFIDDGNTLWLVVQAASKAIYLTKSVNAGSTWTNYTLAGQGQVRSVGKYFDRSLASVLVVLTEDGLYAIDETNYRLKLLQRLPFPGRGMVEWGGALYIFMDAMHVYQYTQTEAHTTWNEVSPGNGEAMPSGKDFREDADGTVVLAVTASGIYAAWSGDGPTSGTLNRALCLFYDGVGWHFIWRAADTTGDTYGYAARALLLDPTSGDLLFVGITVSGSHEVRTHDSVRIVKCETDPRLLSANVYETAGYLESTLLSFDPTALSTTIWDVFHNTEGSQASPAVSLQTSYGTDGAVATTTSLAAQTANRTTVAFGTGSVGVNFVTVRFRWTFVATATVSTLVHNIELAFLKIAAVRWAYLFEIDVQATVADQAGQTDASTVISNLKTVLASATKITCSYAYESSLSLMPIAPWQAAEHLQGADFADVSEGIWQVLLAEV